MTKSDREIMEIPEALDARGCVHSAASLAGVDPKTVRRYVAAWEAGVAVTEPVCSEVTSVSRNPCSRSRGPFPRTRTGDACPVSAGSGVTS